jgi:hypothetical protein
MPRPRGERPLVAAIVRRSTVRAAVAARPGGEVLALVGWARATLLMVVRPMAVLRTWPALLLVARPLAAARPLARFLTVTRSLTLTRFLAVRWAWSLPREVKLLPACVLTPGAPLARWLAALAVTRPGAAWLVWVLKPAAPSGAAVERRPTGAAMARVARGFHFAPYSLAGGCCTAGHAPIHIAGPAISKESCPGSRKPSNEMNEIRRRKSTR